MYKEQELLIIFLYAYTIYLISLISLYSISTLLVNFNYTTFIIIVTKYYLTFTQNGFHKYIYNKRKISSIRNEWSWKIYPRTGD